jgi:hypothetical protein
MKKNLFAVFAALLVLAACSVSDRIAEGSAEAAVSAKTTGQADTPVQLTRASSYDQYAEGLNQYDRHFEVRVQNLAYVKQVFVRILRAGGQWTNISLSYAHAADSGYEIWSGDLESMYSDIYSNQFCVGYSVNGSTYWDNNAGSNYLLPNSGGTILGRGFNVGVESVCLSSTSLSVTLNVRNLAYNKTVKVIYTTNNWVSSVTVNANYQSLYMIGYAVVSSPDAAGFEYWSASADPGRTNGIQFYVECDQNGVASYDNNWGANYAE